jgi:hypothetical protein
VRLLKRRKVKVGLGKEAAEQAGPVLHLPEPGLHQDGELGAVASGEVGQGPLEVRGVGVRLKLLPPSGCQLWFVLRAQLWIALWTGVPSLLQFGCGFPGCVSGGVGVAGPLLVSVVVGFEALAFGGPSWAILVRTSVVVRRSWSTYATDTAPLARSATAPLSQEQGIQAQPDRPRGCPGHGALSPASQTRGHMPVNGPDPAARIGTHAPPGRQ